LWMLRGQIGATDIVKGGVLDAAVTIQARLSASAQDAAQCEPCGERTPHRRNCKAGVPKFTQITLYDFGGRPRNTPEQNADAVSSYTVIPASGSA
jgi:hypothetical protein